MQCYLDRTFKTKKAVKEAIAKGVKVTCYGYVNVMSTGIPKDGVHSAVGPGEYDRKWYATITVVDGAITKIK